MMRRTRVGRLAAVVLLGGTLAVSAGCGSYWTHRWQDTLDVMEFGVTQSDESQFALYFGTTHLFAIGQSSLRGTMYGLGNSQFGQHELVSDSWGWGFLGEDVYEVASGGATVPETDLAKYDTGILGLVFGRAAGLYKGLHSPFVLHLGWGGLMANLKGAEAVDWLLGWTTLDLMRDDTGTRPVLEEPE